MVKQFPNWNLALTNSIPSTKINVQKINFVVYQAVLDTVSDVDEDNKKQNIIGQP